MIDKTGFAILDSNIATLEKLSKDTAHNVFMVSSQLNAIDFDEVKELHLRDIPLKEPPKSIDALLFKKSNWTFIEFKNGNIDVFEVRRKIFDSLLVFNDITKKTISDMRKNTSFILVYNEHISSLYTISKKVSSLAKIEFIRFNLEYFKHYCFKNVSTYTVEEFKTEFLEKNYLI